MAIIENTIPETKEIELLRIKISKLQNELYKVMNERNYFSKKWEVFRLIDHLSNKVTHMLYCTGENCKIEDPLVQAEEFAADIMRVGKIIHNTKIEKIGEEMYNAIYDVIFE